MNEPLLSEYEIFFRELRSLAHRFRLVGEVVHGEAALSIAERSLLTSLEMHGPRTIPELARGRSVSRQHVQALSRRLLQEGWIVLKANPAHRRSQLLALTTKGRTHLASMRRREEKALAALPRPFREGELAGLARRMQHVREVLEQVEANHGER
jgi:DNA-binding MarR family transcriptional regulator